MPLNQHSLRALERLMGPWFVLDEQTPSAPGVNWQKFLSLIEKGKITPDSIVRGPATGGLWRRASRTPSVATRLGLCWSCQSPLPPDRNLAQCPNCHQRLNGPVNWPEPQPAGQAPAREDQEPEGIEELIDASAEAGAQAAGAACPAGGNGRRADGSGVGFLLLGLVAAAVLAGGAIFISARYFRQGDAAGPPELPTPPAKQEPPDPASLLQPAYTPRPQPQPLPSGALPGELFPEVPEHKEPGDEAKRLEEQRLQRQRRVARRRYELACTKARAGELMAAQGILVDLINNSDPRALPKEALPKLREVQRRILASRPASRPSLPELAGKRKLARTLFEHAMTLKARGKLMDAQKILVRLLNGYPREAWPAGAVAALQDIQASIRAGGQHDSPPHNELERQKRSAEKLLARARRLLARGDLLGAQRPLLEILNDHHPRAWPDGALETFKKIQELLRQAPSTAPKFFGIEARK